MEIKDLANDLQSKLNQGITTFSYKKKDGQVRFAVGTTNTSLIEASALPKNTNAPLSTATSQKYYDLVKRSWRSVRNENVLAVQAFVAKA